MKIKSLNILFSFALTSLFVPGTAAAAESATIRIGWQPTTTVEAQIAHTLRSTNILEKHDLDGQFVMFSYGPNVNEALASGSIDVGFIGDLPSIALINSGAPVTIVARQSTFRGSIIATEPSGIETMDDLEGKRIYGPVGSSIYLAALGMLKDHGVREDVKIVNMGFTNLSDAIQSESIQTAFVWDPWVENFAEKGLAKPVASDTTLTMVIAMRNAYLEEHPKVLERFLKAHKEALLYAANHHQQANEWFQRPAAARALQAPVIERATAYDPQWNAKSLSDIRLSFNKTERERYVGLGRTSKELELFPSLSIDDIKEHLDMEIASELDASPWNFDMNSVEIEER